VILLLSFAALLIALLSRQPILAVTGIVDGAAHLFLAVLFRFALAIFVTLLLLVVRSMVLGSYQDSR
jgi:hypothetical protein